LLSVSALMSTYYDCKYPLRVPNYIKFTVQVHSLY